MNKLELIETLREKSNISKEESRKVVELFFDSMADALQKGDRVEIRGLFAFKVKQFGTYEGRNPKTGETIVVRPKKRPSFKPGTDLAQRVNVEGNGNGNGENSAE